MRKLLDSPWLYFGAAAVLVVALVASQFRYEVPPKRVGSVDELARLRERDDLNVLFILVDTLRADHLGCYGYERATSPNIDALAARGIRFARNEAQSSWTKASMASLWTAMYPQRTGILRYPDGVPDEARLPAEILAEHGFYTAGIFRNSWVAANFGFGQGFDRYVKPLPNFSLDRFKNRSPSSKPLQGSDQDVTQSAVEFLQQYHDRRFFLYLHYMDAHQYAYDSTSDLFGTTFLDLYDNAIHWVDINVGYVMTALRNLGLAEKTLVVLVADHGEAFFEHGFEGHAKGLYDEVQHTPWIVIPPFDLEPGVVVGTQVANVDVWPTIFDLLGIEGALPDAQGLSTLPLILAEAKGEPVPSAFAPRPVFSHIDRHWGKVRHEENPYFAVVETPYRLHHKLKFPNQDQLYDHSIDPDEQENIAAEKPELAERLRADIDTYRQAKPAWDKATEELSELELNQLRALGYKID